MLKQIALVTLTAAALVASPSLGHATVISNGIHLNGAFVNGLALNGLALNGLALNGAHVNGHNLGLWAPSWLNGVEPAGREVYFVGEQAGGESSTVLTIELPRVTR